ncbi:fatty acid hydroxylase [Virgibacillus sp. MSP4-1]|uniref:sterol desaturase family protein n=1 Tax=Virgibacillus sp. MSP4-1 TaxID=2700081 RepID=UPI0005C6FAD1|nr:sterol desaturase family protein [Virgibacillus sp. MSP4-1]QHS24582.1 fatty acid hydroxylase [Virgibacillus sp. MSP4-1]
MLILFFAVAIYTFQHMLQIGTWIAMIIGAIAYAISEYMVHRFVFHMQTPENPVLLKMIKRLHYDHHVDPKDVKLLFLPLWFSLPNFIILSLIFYSISTSLKLTIAFATGLITYFLFYEWKHYVAHKPIKPKTKFGKQIKKTHLWHHYKNENYWYGVIHTSVDKTLGTYRHHDEVEKSKTAKNLEKRA